MSYVFLVNIRFYLSWFASSSFHLSFPSSIPPLRTCEESIETKKTHLSALAVTWYYITLLFSWFLCFLGWSGHIFATDVPDGVFQIECKIIKKISHMQTILCKIALFVNLSYISVNLLHLYTKKTALRILDYRLNFSIINYSYCLWEGTAFRVS